MKIDSLRINSMNPVLRPWIKRLNLRSVQTFPHFMGIGTQKGGTTSLYWYLREHPEIYLPEPKEIQYFSIYSNREPKWYYNQFKEAKPGQLRGEITPYYLFHPFAAERISSLIPWVKLIVLLRDPVERTLSQYFHACRLGFEDLSFEDAIKAEQNRLEGVDKLLKYPGSSIKRHQRNSYLSRSQYEIQLGRYFKLFNKRQIFILKSEDFRDNTQKSLKTITSFLKLHDFEKVVKPKFDNKGKGESDSVSIGTRERLREILEPTYRWCKENLGLVWDEA